MSSKRPDGNIPLRGGFNTVSLDPDVFDVNLTANGVKLVHWRGMRCPVGLTDRDGSKRALDDHEGCSNGMRYTKAGEVTALFTSNDNSLDQNDIGLIDGSTVQITTPRTYDDSEEELQVAPFDRFYLDEDAITVPHWELVEAHATGRDRLSFPAVKVMDIVDNRGKEYGVEDYTIENGQIVWVGARPGFNAELNKGDIFAIRYTYRPFWFVTKVRHQIRVARIETPLEVGVLTRMPQSFMLKREVVFLKESKDPLAPDPASPAQVQGPRVGAYGPR